MVKQENFKNTVLKIIKFVIILLAIYITLTYLLKYLSPFILGYILAVMLYPLFKVFNSSYKIPKAISAMLCIIILIFFIIFILSGIIGQIVKEGKDFLKDTPIYLENVKYVLESINETLAKYLSILPDNIEALIFNFYENSKYLLTEFLKEGLTDTSVHLIKKIPNFFMILLLGVISSYLILIDKENIEKFILKQIPRNYLGKLKIIKKAISQAVFGYIKSQFIIMCLISTICFIGLCIARVPYALFIAVIIGIIDAFPVLGSGFVLWPWSVYNIITKNYSMAIILIVVYIIILISRQFIEPKIMGKQMGVHPLSILISIYIGIRIFGVLGVIIAPIILVVIKSLQNENILPKWR